MSKYVYEKAKEFCVYRQWKGSLMQDVIEFYATEEEARKAAKKEKKSPEYKVIVGRYE